MSAKRPIHLSNLRTITWLPHPVSWLWYTIWSFNKAYYPLVNKAPEMWSAWHTDVLRLLHKNVGGCFLLNDTLVSTLEAHEIVQVYLNYLHQTRCIIEQLRRQFPSQHFISWKTQTLCWSSGCSCMIIHRTIKKSYISSIQMIFLVFKVWFLSAF